MKLKWKRFHEGVYSLIDKDINGGEFAMFYKDRGRDIFWYEIPYRDFDKFVRKQSKLKKIADVKLEVNKIMIKKFEKEIKELQEAIKSLTK